ncbi:hypothetical protein pb186bvf_005057 [Paramecium bursaria]
MIFFQFINSLILQSQKIYVNSIYRAQLIKQMNIKYVLDVTYRIKSITHSIIINNHNNCGNITNNYLSLNNDCPWVVVGKFVTPCEQFLITGLHQKLYSPKDKLFISDIISIGSQIQLAKNKLSTTQHSIISVKGLSFFTLRDK